jgi:hypothetical protein
LTDCRLCEAAGFKKAVDALNAAVSEPKLDRHRIKRAAAALIEACDWECIEAGADDDDDAIDV